MRARERAPGGVLVCSLPPRPGRRRSRQRARRLLAIAVLALALAAALPAGASAALVLKLPSVALALPDVALKVPEVKVPEVVSGIGVSVPETTVSVPSVTVSVPEVTVSTPVVTVSTPAASVTTPSVSVSTPSVGTSSGAGAGETPAHGESSGGGSSGGSAGGGGSSGGSGGGSNGGGSPGSPSAPASSGTTAASPIAAADRSQGAGGGAATPAPGHLGRAHGGTHSHARGAGKGGSHSARGSNRGPAGAGGGGGALLPVADHGGGGGGAASSGDSGKGESALQSIGRHVPLPLPVPDWSKPIILLLALLAIWFAVRARLASRRARRLERQRATLLRDVGAMQAALVPEIPERVAGLAVSVGYRPAEGPAAGGDFYDVFSPQRGKVAIILGDVAGHGHEALTQAALTRYTVRAYMQTGMEPRSALALAGRVLGDPVAERFATVVVGLYDIRAGLLTFACAGHPPPLLHGLQTREPPLVCASPPIGWTAPTGRRQSIVSLPRGAVACFFSDGLLEARCGSDARSAPELLGRERLSELLASLGARPDAGRLLERVRGAADATPDDMAACIFVPELTVVGSAVHIEELELDRRALEAGQGRRFLETCMVASGELELTLARAVQLLALAPTVLLRARLESGAATAEAIALEDQPQSELALALEPPATGLLDRPSLAASTSAQLLGDPELAGGPGAGA